MPKVNIYQPAYAGLDIETGLPTEPVQDRRISVGWSKGQYAQIGVGWVEQVAPTQLNINASNLIATPVLGTSTAAAGTLPAGWAPGETDEHGRRWETQWMDLDRHTINQLIRELRKARDEAFGRDE